MVSTPTHPLARKLFNGNPAAPWHRNGVFAVKKNFQPNLFGNVLEAEVVESTMSGAPIMEESEEVELTDDDAWEIVKDFIFNDHVPPASDMPAAITRGRSTQRW